MIDLNNLFTPNAVNVTFNDFIFDEKKTIEEQINNLKEDLYQASFKNNLIDIGWYPSFDKNGRFVISIIKDFNWEKPIFEFKTRNINELIKVIEDKVSNYIYENS
ncbi:hypothetical protein [Avibacterium paragallinarum]|uniref:hypothetical protein n=1 Tax=Avibacterium TaxID=292486 RepID=UPI0021F79E43|nr:hypothetical protein [Avibacterium paragallinarum]UXN34503.1 hypothetical protein N8E86_10685 [Avibacterium paragallinarum]UXN36577.1 hypothetical protein N8E87_10480 [Avibacterium paragallinarum]